MDDGKEGHAAGAARRIGVRDIARLAGVAPITVSRALSRPDSVAAATRERIDAAIAATGYIPDLVARSLTSQRSRLVGAVIPTMTGSIAAEFVRGLADVLKAHRYGLLLADSGFDSTYEEEIVRTFLGRRVDAVYLTGRTHTATTRRLLRKTLTPTVEIATLPDDPIDLAVGFSNHAAARTMTTRLIGRGHRRIAFLAPPAAVNDRSSERFDGYRAALEAAGLAVSPELVLERPLTLDAGADAVTRLIATATDVDALFCTSDVLAAGAIFECQRRAIAVPGRLAIAGFEDIDLARQIVPALTTVRLPRYDIGATAARLLLDRIEGRKVDRHVVDLGFEIVERDSA